MSRKDDTTTNAILDNGALKRGGKSVIDNLERVPNKDKPAVMERIKELHNMVINVRPLLPDYRESVAEAENSIRTFCILDRSM